MGKAVERAAISSLPSHWRGLNQKNWVLAELSRSRLDDNQASMASIIELIYSQSGRNSVRGRAMQIGVDIGCT